MVFSVKRAIQSCKYFPQIFSEFAVLLISLHLINFFFNQSMIYMQEQRMTSKSDSFIPYMFAVAFVGFITQALIKVIWTLLICNFFNKKISSHFQFLKTHAEQGLIESLRSFFKAVLWGFLFIIPGIVKMVRYQFVLFFVALSKKYERGEVDALKGSEELTRGHFFALCVLILLFSALSFFLNSTELITSNPLSVITMEVLGFVTVTVETIYLLLLFQDLQNKKGLQ